MVWTGEGQEGAPPTTYLEALLNVTAKRGVSEKMVCHYTNHLTNTYRTSYPDINQKNLIKYLGRGATALLLWFHD